MMIREAFLATAIEARGLIASRDVARRWNTPSALADLTIGALTGHLARSILLPEQYLASPEPGATDLLTADQYFNAVGLTNDLADELNAQIRDRAVSEAADGRDALLARVDVAIEHASDWTLSERPDRRVASLGGRASLLDEYLVTRLVELAIHVDDLCVSLDRSTPDLPAVTMMCAFGCMLQMARARHGDLAVLRAMSRRERDSPDALRVF